jgi:hypothetical protein
MARCLASFPEKDRKAKALFRLENCFGLSKCGAMDYFRAIYRPMAKVMEKVEAELDNVYNTIQEEEVGYSSYTL